MVRRRDDGTARRAVLGALVGLLASIAAGPVHAGGETAFDDASALRYSQAAIGRSLDDLAFVDRDRRPVRLADFRGKPLVVNLIYTSCYHTCPMIAHNLIRAVAVAQRSFGPDGFHVATIGFDIKSDTPERMAAFARTQGMNLPNWNFLSGDAPTIDHLTENLGFVFYASAKGFDHLAQVSVIDAQGKVFHQIYGSEFEPPQLVEPLKDLIFGRARSLRTLDGIANRIRLFCTIYDPALGRYRFDYRSVIMVVVGGLTLLGIGSFVARAWFRHWRQGGAA